MQPCKTKQQLRELVLTLFNQSQKATLKAWGQQINLKTIEIIKKINPKSVHIYLSTKKEVYTSLIIEYAWNQSIAVLVPIVISKYEINQVLLTKLTKTTTNIYGIEEPIESSTTTEYPDIIIVPGLGFDGNGNRLGRGSGHYDRFLAKHSKSIKIGLAYPFQILDLIPKEQHDQVMDLVITADKIYGQIPS